MTEDADSEGKDGLFYLWLSNELKNCLAEEWGERLASLSPFVEAMSSINNQPTVYVCENYTCKTPIKDLAALKAILN